MSQGTNVELSWEGLVPKSHYDGYGAYYNGYQGFDFQDMEIITRKGVEHNDYGKDGFGTVLHGDAEAYVVGHSAPSFVSGYTYGWLKSSDADETFDLKSGIFAAAINNKVQVAFRTYYANGAEKADVHIHFTKNATAVNFANYGADFQNISAVEILSTDKNYPYPVTMDNLKVHWNGTVPGHHHFSHLLLAEASTHQAIGQSSGSNAADHFHSVLTSLATSSGHTDSGSALTSQFILPVADHFGT